MNPIPVIKFAVGVAASLGAGVVVENAIKFATPIGVKAAEKVAIFVGTVVLSGMVADKASDYAEEKFIHTVIIVDKVIKKTKIAVEKAKKQVKAKRQSAA